ncbi:MAG: ABC transporter permease [Planctomycetes bacterium]|nr:ABC transporter permease [Planctomycetota bacterium]
MALPLSYNYRSLLVRWKTTLLAVSGIALVVLVFVALLGMSSGFRHALRATGSPANAIVTQKGSGTELTSVVPKEQTDVLLVDSRVQRDAAGNPLGSPEQLVVVNLKHRRDGTPTNVAVRGVTPAAFDVRSGVRVREGRRFTFGLDEVIVGERIAQRIQGLDLGGAIRFQKRDWRITGVFTAEGSGFESEIWMDSKVLRQAFNRREMSQSLTLRLTDRKHLAELAADLARDPKLQVEVQEERQYYEDQAGPIASNLLYLAYFVSTIMGIGAVFGGMNTMYALVASRTREIATLRALGFSRRSVLLAFLIESQLLALAGAALGCALAVPVSGLSAATSGPTFSELAFAFRITHEQCTAGVIFAALMGLAGGLLPALRAARMPIAAALKEA